MRSLISAAVIAATLALAAAPASAQSTDLSEVSTASYTLDNTHAFLTWSVKHNGISDYVVNFTDYSATLDFNAGAPESSALNVTINPMALNTYYPNAEKKSEWETELSTDPKFLNGAEFGEITFTSTTIETTGDTTGRVTGDLSFRGMTKPVTMDVTWRGVANSPWLGERDLIGFDATTTLSRAEWGVPGVNSVSDDVTITFSGEFVQDE